MLFWVWAKLAAMRQRSQLLVDGHRELTRTHLWSIHPPMCRIAFVIVAFVIV
jgi:hypothetical protein